jgi:hypothetical protein
MAEPVTIEVFPNTGHQYFSIPLLDLIPEKHPYREDKSKLEEIARKNLGRSFEPLDAMIGWVRFQYDYDDDKGKPLLKLAVETNLGRDNRGFPYDTEEVSEKPDDEPIPTRFAARDEQELWSFDGEIKISSVPSVQGASLPVSLTIKFRKPGGSIPIDVDLIVDLGNTRTAAVLLETPGQDGRPLRIAPLQVVPRGSPYPDRKENAASFDKSAIIPSWLVLHQSVFSHLEPPVDHSQSHIEYEEFQSEATGAKRYRKRSSFPQAFVELSPALVGGGNSKQGAARILAKSSVETDGPFFLSSPKRYVWDDQPQDRPYWYALPNSQDVLAGASKSAPLVPLGGLIRYFMEQTGADVCSEESHDNILNLLNPQANPTYPRRAAICWFALSIIESAYRQMNAPAYMLSTARVSMPRRLRWIRVTFPAGWTTEEKDSYLAEWKRAIELFKLTHLERGFAPGPEKFPALTVDEMDEAVCSQLPIIYAQIQTLGQDAQRWIDLFGNGEKVTVMNLDIGGGTTDMSVIQYENANKEGPNIGVSLTSKLLFRFGHSIAGDMVVKAVIERVLLPAWIKASDRTSFFASKPQARKALKELFGPVNNTILAVDPFMPKKLARITRLVLAPLATLLLQRVAESDDSNATWEPLDIKELLKENVIIGLTLDDLNKLCVATMRTYGGIREGDTVAEPFSAAAKIVVNPEAVNECIKDVFSGVFHHLGIVAAEFKCHMVIVSGKPSELPLVRKLIDEAFPIPPQRIITVKNFPAGRWYPFNSDGKINDAKTCTVVGAALFQEILNGALRNFSLTPLAGNEADSFSEQYYWGIIPPKGSEAAFYLPRTPQNPNGFLLFSPEDYKKATSPSPDIKEFVKEFGGVPLDCRIGRQIRPIKNVAPDPVYELRWKPSDLTNQPPPPLTATIKLKWISTRGKSERIEMVSIKPNNPKVQASDIQLKLNTLPPPANPLSGSGDFWMDLPEFDTSGLFAHLPAGQR